MAEVKLTVAQQAVVDHEGGALLVSAAAGSGKTKVLVDRLMRRVCHPGHPQNVNDFLMITYTKAAAAELRGKISAELGKRLAEEPGNRHLQRQMSLIYTAEISTIHAFCANLLRTYAHVLDIPSDFRVAEESECAALREKALEQSLEEAYSRIFTDEDLRALVDVFGLGRDDRAVIQAVASLYSAVQCHPYPDDWIAACCEALDMTRYDDCAATPWGAYLIARFHEFLQNSREALSRAMAQMQGEPALEQSYLPVFADNERSLGELMQLQSWDALAASIPDSFGRLTAARKFEDKQLLEALKGVRSRCLEELRKWKEVFYAPSEESMADLTASAAALRGAFSLVRAMTKAYEKEKRRRRMLDFGDLEHLAIRLLLEHDTGKPTATAGEISRRFTEIMVDEYQDSNEIQDRIFAAISQNGENRFMVGDVKQSIYRFRLADPTIFLEKYHSFADYRRAAPGAACKILLSENFRSRPEILEAVNQVFSAVMSPQVGDLAYTQGEALKPGLHFEPLSEPAVELHCIETAAEGEEDSPDKTQTEADFVARRIASLLRDGTEVCDGEGKRPVRPGDIVVLLRSVGSAAPAYLNALQALGIPCVSDRGGSVLDTQEAEVLCAILQTIDNPHNDIALAGALASPVFAFSAAELAAIRAHCPKGDFYDALAQFAKTDEKSKQFLERLQSLREQARWLPLQALLRLVYDETQMESIYGAMADGAVRTANLECLFEFSSGYAAGGKSLMQLTAYLAQLRLQHMTLTAGGPAGGGAVTLMSIHKSKGLEFPIVFLADLSRRFNTEDLRENVMTHPTLFAASSIVDRENGVRFPTIAKKAIALCKQRESLSEELRVLYVAMTRAKERLIMTYCAKYLQSDLCAIAAEAREPVTPAFAGRARNPGWWVLMAAMCRTEAGELFQYAAYPQQSTARAYPWLIRLHLAGEQAAAQSFAAEEQAAPPPELPPEEVLLRSVRFQYPHAAASGIPSKVTATQLKGRLIDEEAAEQAQTMLPRGGSKLHRPDFAGLSRGLSAREKGTANHLFLQFAVYAHCRDEQGLAGELERLVRDEFLTQQQAQAVHTDQMLRLFTSALGARIFAAKQAIREFKFSVLVDADTYYPGAQGEEIMLQGVVDCLLVEETGLCVIDFKTDGVKPGQEQARAAVYSGQLEAYALALSRIYKQPVRSKILYFLTTGQAVPL